MRIPPHKIALPAAGVGFIVLLALWIAGLFSVAGGGSGQASVPPAIHVQAPDLPPAPQTQPSAPGRTIVVTIEQHDYMIEGKPRPLDSVLASARSAAASGANPPAQIVIVPDSREAARVDLEKALGAEAIAFSELNTPAATQP